MGMERSGESCAGVVFLGTKPHKNCPYNLVQMINIPKPPFYNKKKEPPDIFK